MFWALALVVGLILAAVWFYLVVIVL